MKRLLALDGGGIRGLITIEILAEVERQLRERLGRRDLVLADCFDYLGGTSTGGIIATLLALGMPVEQIRAFYVANGPAMFTRSWAPWRSMYRDANLAQALQEIIGPDTTLGSERLRTLLLLVMRNADTDSPWPVSSNPAAKYNDRSLPDCNLDLPLWQLVRASAAAPVFFRPQPVRVGSREYAFVDGGMTTYNNPGFLLLLMATLAPYRLCWPTGRDQLLLVSIGTGMTASRGAPRNIATGLRAAATDTRTDTTVQQDLLCRAFGRCVAGDLIDTEVGDLRGPAPEGWPVLCTYVRYNAELSRAGLDALGLLDVDPAGVGRLDSVRHVPELQRVGRAVAERRVRLADYEAFFPA